MSAHTLGPFMGTDSIGWHATCSCSHEVAGATRDDLRRAHQRHAGEGAAQPGLARARQALADTVARGKAQPAEVQG